MSKYIIIQTTTDSQEWTNSLVADLLENKYSADVQLSQIDSHYWWDGRVRNKSETLLTIKSRIDLFDIIESTIRKHSKYDVPQIIITSIVGGGADYLNWIETETKTS